MPDVKKALVVNKYHFVSGGAERYFLSVMPALKARGIEAIPLAIRYAKTLPTPYERYFPEPVLGGGAHKIQNQSPSPAQALRLAADAVYNRRVLESARRLLREERPDVAYLLNINNHISPSVIDACAEAGVPVVMRLSDFNLVCASNMYFRSGKPCTDCRGGLHHALRYRCVHGSLARTAVAVWANSWHRWSGIYKKVSAFVAPSEFMRQDLIRLGFDADIVHRINTFVAPQAAAESDTAAPYALFLGRFTDYKGPDDAVRAFARLRGLKFEGARLVLMGDEGDADARRVRELAARLEVKNVEFWPFERDKARLLGVIQRSMFTVVPSRFFENLPNSVLESFACGRAVVASRLGSIPEVVKDGVNGLLFEPGDPDDFARKMQTLMDDPELCRRLGDAAHRSALEEYSESAHMDRLLGVFAEVCGRDVAGRKGAAGC